MIRVPLKRSGVRVKIKRVAKTSFFKPVVPRKDYGVCFRCRDVKVDEFVWYCKKCQRIVDQELHRE